MKIIGTKDRDTFIAEVSKMELEKVFDKYYDKLGEIMVGKEFLLCNGYDFRSDIQAVCAEMTSTMKRFERARDTLQRFTAMVNGLPAITDNEL